MKKRIAIICCLMLVVMSLTAVFAACGNNLSDDELKSLRSRLYNLYADEAAEKSTSYKMVGEISDPSNQKVKSDIAWTISGTDKVTVSSDKDANGNYTINVPSAYDLDADVTYTLTGTLVKSNGQAYTGYNGDKTATYSVSFTRVVRHQSGPMPDATITFDDADKATLEGSHSKANSDGGTSTGYAKATWTENGITVVNAVTTNASPITQAYTNPARFYASTTIEISYTSAFKAIRLNLDDYQNGQYLGGFDGMTVAGTTIKRAGSTVIITLDTAATKFTSASLVGQTRIYSVEIFTSEVPELPKVDVNVPTGFTAITTPVAGTYKMAIWQANLSNGQYIYMNGSMSGYYFASTTDPSAAIDIVLAASGSGWTMKVSGTNNYIRMYPRTGSTAADPSSSLEFSTTECVWTWNDTLKAFYVTIDGTNFYLGTYGTFNTISGSKESYFTQANPNFLAYLGTVAA